jgi:hypothetical protein
VKGYSSGTYVRLAFTVAAYRGALEDYKRECVPLYWAMTQNSPGSALSVLGERETGTARLEEAVAAYRAPLDRARTQINVCRALTTMGERTQDQKTLTQARDALDLGWEVYYGARNTQYDELFRRQLREIDFLTTKMSTERR